VNPVLAALDAVIDALTVKRAAAIEAYGRYWPERDDPKSAELADWYLGQWRGLGDALDALREQRTITVRGLADAALGVTA
jgi:hypothetical protein